MPPEGIQVSEIATLARVRKQSAAEAVAQLERAGYVERRPDPNDGRARLVFLTPSGEAVRPIAQKAGRQVEARWAELIGAEALELLRATMGDLLTAIRQEPIADTESPFKR